MTNDEVRLIFRLHAIERMFERNISLDDVREAISSGETIEEYPHDTPYPSRLILGFSGNRPIHIVVAEDNENMENIVVTVYEPDSARWDSQFRRRSK